MRSISSFVAIFSATVAPAAFAASLGHFDAKTLGFTKRVDYSIQQELSSILSSTAVVLSPLDDGFVDSTERYMSNVQPKIELSVQVGTEGDVATVVSTHEIPKMVESIERLTIFWFWLLHRFNMPTAETFHFTLLAAVTP